MVNTEAWLKLEGLTNIKYHGPVKKHLPRITSNASLVIRNPPILVHIVKINIDYWIVFPFVSIFLISKFNHDIFISNFNWICKKYF